ncbi:MAG: hypothetical protein JWP63_3580 [Candidatus Solibacter sp.]|jgi:hypothetical protein|nr:hypothetical protein [Candidatus Solibacter sp.]
MRIRCVALLLAVAFGAAAQKYNGPFPAKPDLPYLKHADSLIATEATEAKEEKGKKDDITYVVAGAASSARTPLASPIFLLQTEKLAAASLALYRLESKNGHREITFAPKKAPKAIRMEATRISDKLFRLEVEESLEPGEYSISPEGSNKVFCFQVY